MPEGVQYPDIIDKVIEEDDGSVSLVMREDRPWSGSDDRFVELRKQINTYAAYARQGQLEKDFPDLAGNTWRVLSDEVRGDGFREYGCTMTEFLTGILLGEFKALAGDYPRDETEFFRLGPDETAANNRCNHHRSDL